MESQFLTPVQWRDAGRAPSASMDTERVQNRQGFCMLAHRHDQRDGSALPVMVLFTKGTGGFWPLAADVDSAEQVYACDPAEQLEFIRTALGLTMTDLARIFDVARPTVYAWLSGSEPRPEKARLINELRETAARFDSLGLERMEKLVRRPLFEGGRSLVDLLVAGEPVDEALGVLQGLSQRESQSRNAIKGVGGPLMDAREVADSLGLSFDHSTES